MATVTTAGAVPSSPASLLNQELVLASALSPGLTANLPGSLIEDMSSTAAGAMVVQDQAFVDLFNSISPYTANAAILYQLGAVYGVARGQGSNTSVYVTFTGLQGFRIPKGFVVSDGTHQYAVQDGGIIGTSGQTPPLYCLATTSGSWAVPTGTVTHLITSVPTGYTLICTNQAPGLIGQTQQTLESYQAQVFQAGLATAQGVPNFIRTNLFRVAGVQPNLVAVVNVVANNQWQIIVGGGDPFQVANAIFNSVPDIAVLVSSQILVNGITNSATPVVTTDLTLGTVPNGFIQITGAEGISGINSVFNDLITSITWSTGTVSVTLTNAHGLATGNTATAVISGCSPTGYNGSYTITSTGTNTFTYPLSVNPGTIITYGVANTGFTIGVLTPNTFTINTDTTSSGSWTTGGVVTPNSRNQIISIIDYPDTYTIPFIVPYSQTVSILLEWNTISINTASAEAVAQLTAPPIANYINSIYVGQPINIYEIQNIFQNTVASIIPPSQIAIINITVTIDGVVVPPVMGEGVVYGDAQSYFSTSSALVSVVEL